MNVACLARLGKTSQPHTEPGCLRRGCSHSPYKGLGVTHSRPKVLVVIVGSGNLWGSGISICGMKRMCTCADCASAQLSLLPPICKSSKVRNAFFVVVACKAGGCITNHTCHPWMLMPLVCEECSPSASRHGRFSYLYKHLRWFSFHSLGKQTRQKRETHGGCGCVWGGEYSPG